MANKIFSSLTILFSISIIVIGVLFYYNYVSTEILIILLGFTQLFGGLSQITTPKNSLYSTQNDKKSKIFGKITIVIGTALILLPCLKIILN